MGRTKAETGAGAASPIGPSRNSRIHPAVTISVLVIYQLPLTGYLVHGDSLRAQAGREGIFWILTGILVAYILLGEKRTLTSIGWRRPTWRTVASGSVGALAMIAGMAFIYVAVFPALGVPTNESQATAVKSLPFLFRVFLVTRAAVFEEIYYRGFMIERLDELTRRRWLASFISLAAFTAAHLESWGWAHLIVAAFGGAVLTGLYLVRRDLGANMLAHFMTDGVGFLLG